MGGAVSSGRDNNELIDNLVSGNYIRTKQVERVMRALDRADYMTPEARDQAYKDLAWRNGPLHLSSPCIYSEVMEGLELKRGLSFLNIGSGTGYLSTLAGLILGTSCISHGVEVHPTVVEYAVTKIGQFIENSPVLDDFDFCEPKYYQGNGLCLTPLLSGYDRVYCGAGCPTEYEDYFKKLIKVGGILVMPLNDTLLQVKRISETKWVSRNLLNVSFATLRTPTKDEQVQQVKLDKQTPVRLQLLSRSVVRRAMRLGVMRRHPELVEAPRKPLPPACPRRICIPIEPGSHVEGLNVLHDLDSENGANEMNALLSLVISMGHNRVAGALRFDRVTDDDDSGSSDDEDEDDDRPDEDHDHDHVRPLDDQNRSDDPQSDSQEPDEPKPGNSKSDDKSPDTKDKDKDRDSKDKNNQGDSDSDDDKPNDKPRSRKVKLGSRQRRLRRLEGMPRLPNYRSYSDLLTYRCNLDQPSTSSKASKTSTSEDSTNSTDKKSEESTSDNGDCSKEPKPSTSENEPNKVEHDVKIMQVPGSQMDWEISLNISDSEDEAEDKSKAKRQKLDSGIGEATPSTSSPDKSKTESDSEHSHSHTDEGTGSFNSSGLTEEEECLELTAHAARRRRRILRGGDARRVRLSLLMKQAVRELPLPHALKKFVNLGRCFEF